jgi:Tfp pilus assembly PilM family ATPase
MRRRTLPLGIDLGSTRIRVASLELDGKTAVLQHVATASTSTAGANATRLGEIIRDMLRLADIRETRAVCALGEPHALLREVRFPPMTRGERNAAAKFEAARFLQYPVSQARVQTIPTSDVLGRCVIGVASNISLRHCAAVLRAARLRVLAVDHEACAYRRVFPSSHAILDVGHEAARLHVYGKVVPLSIALPGGSKAFSDAIAQTLGIDSASAELRKCSVGLGGAGEAPLAAFAKAVGKALAQIRGQGCSEVAEIVMVGNGARLSGLAARLERDTGCRVSPASALYIDRQAYPVDIVRSRATDWALSVGIALWSQTGDRSRETI